MPLPHGPVQRRVAVLIGCVHVRPRADQDLGTVHVPPPRRVHQRRVAALRLGVDGRVVLYQGVNDVNMPLHLDGGVQRGETDVVVRILLPVVPPHALAVTHICDLVAHAALVRVGAARSVRGHLEAEAALHEDALLRRGHRVLHLGPPADQHAAHLREPTERGHGEGGEDADVQVAVVLALHVLDEGVDVVGLDGLHERLRLPA
mmetsp:Transcript_8369/g.20808  ORF Transcript_8369/g.20808 Transcript_8369/m.20808 type:complete len:204 (-) Transcript_8369:331-942(-)